MLKKHYAFEYKTSKTNSQAKYYTSDKWARAHQGGLLPQWRNVLFSDESRFGLLSDDYRERVWRERGGQTRLATAIGVAPYRGGAQILNMYLTLNHFQRSAKKPQCSTKIKIVPAYERHYNKFHRDNSADIQTDGRQRALVLRKLDHAFDPMWFEIIQRTENIMLRLKDSENYVMNADDTKTSNELDRIGKWYSQILDDMFVWII
nr:unnamed protein product [Callosobruchus chinensis]